MAIHHVNKGIAGFSMILGSFVLLVSIWVFGSIVYREQSVQPEGQDLSKTNNNESDVMLQRDAVNISSYPSTNATIEEQKSFSFWAKFDQMPQLFKGIVIGCAWIAFIGAVFQMSSSIFILFSSAKNVLNRTKYLIAFHFLAFIILLATFFTPVAYDRINEKFYTMTSFNTQVKDSFQKLEEDGLCTFFVTDLHAYYFILVLDCCFLFVIMIIMSCILRFYHIPKLDFEYRYQ